MLDVQWVRLNKGYVSQHGYKRILRPGHPRADYKGYVFEHILIYEQFYNCCIPKYSIIHHLNNNRLDNRIENLEAMIRAKHTSLHQRYRKKVKEERVCANCNSITSRISRQKNRFSGSQHWYKFGAAWLCYGCYHEIYFQVIEKPRRKLRSQI